MKLLGQQPAGPPTALIKDSSQELSLKLKAPQRIAARTQDNLLERIATAPAELESTAVVLQPSPRQPAVLRPRMPLSRRQAIVMAGLIIAASICGTYTAAKWWELQDKPLRPYEEMKGQWIQATPVMGMDIYTSAFRRDFRIGSNVRNAWISVAACDGFEVVVNGRAVGWQHMWRPTRPFQTNLSERGQWVTWPKVALALNFAREYQWTDHKNYLLPVFIDLSPYLKVGTNVVGIEIESRQAPARVRFDGAVTLANGKVIPLVSGPEWKGEVDPPNNQNVNWRSRDYSVLGWRPAMVAETPPGQPLRMLNPRVYSEVFQGNWIRHPQARAQDSVWYEAEWTFDQKPDEIWMRLATNRNYELFINGRRSYPDAPDDRGLETGEWIYSHELSDELATAPEQMLSDDVGENFVTHQYIGPAREPRGTDENRFRTITPESPDNSRNADPAWVLEKQKPLSMRHDEGVGVFVGYNLTGLLHKGTNTIALRLNRPDTSDPANWPGQIAVDGEASFSDGTRQPFFTDAQWKTSVVNSDMEKAPMVSAQSVGPAVKSGFALTKMQYRGAPLRLQFMPGWVSLAASIAGAGLLGFCGLLLLGTPFRYKATGLRQEPSLSRPWRTKLVAGVIAILFDALLTFTFVLLSVIIVQAAFGERSEQLWMMIPSVWQWSLVGAAALGLLAAAVRLLRLTAGKRLRAVGDVLPRLVRELPTTRLWTFALIWLCVLTFFLRAYNLEFQPLDYDENPSLLAMLSVARTGIPSYVPDAVWYTRSPLYHYLTGGVIWLFGENLWAARIPSALFSVATGLLLYFCGSRLLKRPWVGMAVFLLTLIHPQMFMTGHMIRFYQQQQFFGLLTAYWFCKGFVTQQSQKYRYLTVAAFLAATLSQEITAVMAVPLSVGYLFFAGRKTIQENTKLLIGVACAMTIIVVDYMVYETHTLTRLEGYSTTMQADIGPHLWEPYNLATVFLSYSRIHLPLSLMFLIGLPAVLWERNRAVLALHLLFFGNIIMLNVMVTQVSARYVYWLFPLLMLLGIDNARAGLAWLDTVMHRRREPAAKMLTAAGGRVLAPIRAVSRSMNWRRLAPDASRLSFAPLMCFVLLFTTTVFAWSPWRLPGSFNTKLLADSNGAFQYIKSQLRPDDLIVVTQPHAKGAMMEIGRVDYELHFPLVYDFVLRQNGRLIERGAGAGVIYSVEQFQKLCSEHGRVWVAIDREQFPYLGEKVDSSGRGARMELFLRQNTKLMHRAYLWNVYLWDVNDGHYRAFRGSDI